MPCSKTYVFCLYFELKLHDTTIAEAPHRTVKCTTCDYETEPFYMKIHQCLISLHKAQEKEYSLDKEQTVYDDLLDAFGLSLKGYNIE